MVSSSRIFVKGLPPSLTVEDFRKHFSKQSPITDAKLIPHRRIGYVGFRTPDDAARAVKYYDRSFIRMSKIGVELARSVDEQRQASRSRPKGASIGKAGLTATIIDTRAKGGELSSIISPTTKELHTGNGPEEGNEKLREFLDVMQPPSKSKGWNDQDALRPASLPVLVTDPHNQRLPATPEKSDGEYEPMRKRIKISEEMSENTTMKKSIGHELPVVASEMRAETDENQASNGAAQDPGPESQPAASDEDWLRSRTSRLLGLVDDEENLVVKSPVPDNDKPENESDKMSELGDEEQSEKRIQHREPTNDGYGNSESSVAKNSHEPATGNGRLFLRNLTYTLTEKDIRKHFEDHGCVGIEEIHLPLDGASNNDNNKGFAHVQFTDHVLAERGLKELDQKPFQGRLLHILPSDSKPETLDEFAISKLPLKKQQHLRRKVEAASSTFNWNSMYMNLDAVLSSVSDRLGVTKSDLLDPTSSDAAVKQAHAETHIIQETKSYFKAKGVNLDAFKRSVRGNVAILVKNFPFNTTADELRNLFTIHGPLKQFLIAPSGTLAIVEFYQADHARSAFSSLSYSKFKGSVLFLEKAPVDLFAISETSVSDGSEARQAKPLITDLLDKDQPASIDTTTLFVRNLNFATTGSRLREAFKSLDGFISARVKTKPDPKSPGQTLSMGFGFLEFRSKEQAHAALAAMDGHKLDGHELLIRASHKAIDAAEERRVEEQAKKLAGRKTKIIIKNLPFETTKKDVRSLFGAYGQLRSVRVPKKFDSSTRGFAFADFVTAREAESAMKALKDTHLLGRRLVLQFAAEAEIDPEAEIEQMRKKVGVQVDKVALQKLTGTGRRKFVVKGAGEDDQLVD